jgi:ribonuclease BN (tRNA processing enzyme)
VHHAVPALGFVLTRGARSVALSGDTGPTERLWEVASAAPGLAAAFLEVAFPDELDELARKAGHLTPSTFARERAKLPRAIDVVAVHMKPRWRARFLSELAAHDIPGLRIGSPREEYAW